MSLDACPSDEELLALAEKRAASRSAIVRHAVDTANANGLRDPAPSNGGKSSTSAKRQPASRTGKGGDYTSRRRPRAVEHEIQAEAFRAAHALAYKYPELALWFAIPNGGQRHVAVAVKMKAEGLKSGVWDTLLPCARGGFIGLWVEFKAPGGRMSDSQADWLNAMLAQGYKCALHTNASDAVAALLDYLSLPTP